MRIYLLFNKLYPLEVIGKHAIFSFGLIYVNVGDSKMHTSKNCEVLGPVLDKAI